ncbi:MAG: thiamine-phosphate synthase family protein [Sulfolobales archaeon]
MRVKALILNKFDLTMREGIHLDVELCKLFEAECYPIITGIVREGNTLLNVKVEEVIKQLKTLDLSKLNTLKLNASIDPSIINYIYEHGSTLEVKVLTLNGRPSEYLTKEYLRQLSVNKLVNMSDILFITSTEAQQLSKMLSIPLESLHDLIKSLSDMLNIKGVGLLNHEIGHNLFVNIIYHDETYLELRKQVELPKDLVATYTALGLARKMRLEDVVKNALEFAERSVEYGLRCGEHIMPDVYWYSTMLAEKFKVLSELASTVNLIEENSHLIVDLIPEVQMNLAYSLPKRFVRGLSDIAAIPGRIVRVGNMVKAASSPEFGASKHLARALMKVMEYNPKIRSIANIRFDDLILKAIERLGYTVSFYDRALEPQEVKRVEGATIPWGVEEAIKRVGYVPDVIYHKGDYGKEAMITVLGETPAEVVSKLLSIGRTLKELKSCLNSESA